MIWDCTLFGGELDMLECRLEELADAVGRFVVVEAPVDHHGHPKPLHYLENAVRFARWKDRIVYVVADLPDDPDPWVREHAQRDAVLPALADAADDDVVLISDVDEFPPPRFLRPDPSSHVRQRLKPDAAVAFLQRSCSFAVDWEHPSPEICSVAARVNYVRAHGLATVRDARSRYPLILGGWHFSWLGGIQGQREKIRGHCHTLTPAQERLIREGRCYREGIHHAGFQMAGVDVDGTWPAMIRERRCPPEWFRPR